MHTLKSWYISFLLLPIVVLLIINGGRFIFFLDHFNLLIHEGGHGIFRMFGDYIYTLGGTLMQIILPSIFIFYFFINDKRWGVQVSLVWLGENLMNVSVYAADARAQLLPLLGGNKVYHDWNWLLSRLGWLQYDKAIGNFFFYIGIIAYIVALLIPLFWKEYTKKNVEITL